MSDIIVDGTGQGYQAKVFSDNSLSVSSVSKSQMVKISESNGEAYIFANGGYPNITTLSTEHAILYVKNISTVSDLHIYSIRSCANQVSKWRMYKNITGGTIISGAVAALDNNLNLSSPNKCDCDSYSGGDGVTYTGGTMFEHWINDVGHSIENFDGAVILGPSASLTITVELDTAGYICCRMIGYFVTRTN